ncbi:hypothetical protein [Colwellia psychrerythraea]|uniref:Uncharacterized protein n=1 Tax=Colwellia psychrerythraea TaxID=28229 RepID=A0A099K917_COLPS|nr:hypothetical protein [Colwellia psychrerythraea]KGJ86861.1 hypothetical protein GAB14E_4688 [Colwellia psychrerythraea]
MALCVIANPDGSLVSSPVSVNDCSGYVLVDSNEYLLMLQTYAITPLEIAQSFTWGFGTYISFWFMGYAIKNARKTIKQV